MKENGAWMPTTEAFKKFLKLPAFNGAFADDKIAKSFVRGVRNGVLHEAETRGWAIWRDEPEGVIVGWESERHVLNRTTFYKALKTEFNSYVHKLREPDSQLRQRFLEKMDDLVKEC